MSQSTKTPEEYLKGPYARVLIPDSETGTYTARIMEFPGCITEANSMEEALKRLEDTAESWIQACLDTGRSIPQPAAAQEFGGKVALRLPRGLHQQAVEVAEFERVSLNQFLVSAIAEKIGATRAVQRTRPTATNVFVANTTINVLKMPHLIWATSAVIFAEPIVPTVPTVRPLITSPALALKGESENG
jgi:predicted RNase H-like HicB family nuclease